MREAEVRLARRQQCGSAPRFGQQEHCRPECQTVFRVDCVGFLLRHTLSGSMHQAWSGTAVKSSEYERFRKIKALGTKLWLLPASTSTQFFISTRRLKHNYKHKPYSISFQRMPGVVSAGNESESKRLPLSS